MSSAKQTVRPSSVLSLAALFVVLSLPLMSALSPLLQTTKHYTASSHHAFNGFNDAFTGEQENKEQEIASIIPENIKDTHSEVYSRTRRLSCSCCYDPREARITIPLQTFFSWCTTTPVILGSAYPAAALETQGTFMSSLKQYFPSALSTKQTGDRVVKVLRQRGYTDENSLFGASICSDEINTCSNKNKCLFTFLTEEYGGGLGAFALGGLAGVPFVGKSGLSAYAHHVPDKDGKLLILYAPHVGISSDGRVGKIQRVGLAKVSEACGAAIGAYKAIASAGATSIPASTAAYDDEEDYIIGELQKRFRKDPSALDKGEVDPIVFTTYQTYCMIRDLLYSEIAASDLLDDCSELAMLGGVIINQYDGSDYFQPLSFQAIKKGGGLVFTEDLFTQTFGKRPALSGIAGNKDTVKDVLAQATLKTDSAGKSFISSLKQYFPSASSTKQTGDRVVKALRQRGYTDKNSLFGASICSDEINTCGDKNKCLFTFLKEEYGGGPGAFALGGLAGVPFVGKSGLSAYAHHVPDKDGKLLILYGPHVGISSDGNVGKIERVGRAKVSEACGAAIGAYKAIASAGATSIPASTAAYDNQEDYIIRELQKRFRRAQSSPDKVEGALVDPIVFTTYQTYCMIRDLLYSEIATSDLLDDCSELAMLGGVIINQYDGSDYFQPLSFQAIKKDGGKVSTEDLFTQTFGKRPALSGIAGNEDSVKDVLAQVLL